MAYGVFVNEEGACAGCVIVDDDRDRALEKAKLYSEEYSVKVQVINLVNGEEVKKERKKK